MKASSCSMRSRWLRVGGFAAARAARSSALQILRVVAGVEVNALVPDLDDLVDRHVEKVAVVRDQHEGVGIVAEILFQPVAGFEIEMVGGLVEQQQVRLFAAAAWPARCASASRRRIPRCGASSLRLRKAQAAKARCRPAPRWRSRRGCGTRARRAGKRSATCAYSGAGGVELGHAVRSALPCSCSMRAQVARRPSCTRRRRCGRRATGPPAAGSRG